MVSGTFWLPPCSASVCPSAPQSPVRAAQILVTGGPAPCCTAQEDEVLRRAVALYKGRNWRAIASHFPGRTDVQCLHRWQKVLDPTVVKGGWSAEEDAALVALVARHGPKKWSLIAQQLPGRIGKQCRERCVVRMIPTPPHYPAASL